jgi:hypothetical protein
MKLKFSEQKLMDNIFSPNDKFDFSQLSLAHPTGIQGGAYFTKIQMNNKPLYIETPKSLTRQGFVKNGKKIYCDLMFDNNDEQLVQWLENLETRCQELIYKKADTWFENKLELNDIETAFASPMRIYKSGKYYLVRVNVKVNYSTSAPIVKIYNENELPVDIDDVTPENNIISIIEVQGIKFTSRNFQIELELKQSMVLNSEKIFENCLIKGGLNRQNKKEPESIESQNLEDIGNTLENVEQLEENVDSLQSDNFSNTSKQQQEEQLEQKEKDNNEIMLDASIETLSDVEELIDNSNDLTEVNFATETSNLETITLKKPNQVYYEIYKAARNKAKEAKKQAIIAFLEAKNIKKTYMLDDLDDSEDSDMDFDNLSEISENDLEKE